MGAGGPGNFIAKLEPEMHRIRKSGGKEFVVKDIQE